jgi:hypothetical protein
MIEIELPVWSGGQNALCFWFWQPCTTSLPAFVSHLFGFVTLSPRVEICLLNGAQHQQI